MDRAGRANPRHLLQIRGTGTDRIRALLARAASLSDGAMRPVHDALRGRTVATLFLEASTRTRTSFQLAATRLGAEVVDLSGSGLSVSKGETLADTARTIEAMGVDAIVVRASQSGAPHVIADAVRCGVVNAGDGRHEHPTQGLLDALALARATGRTGTFDFTGLTYAVVGDIASSRVARSDVAIMTALGARVLLSGPGPMAPRAMEGLAPGVGVERDFDRVVEQADAIQMLRVQFERHGGKGIASTREYRAGYALTSERAGRMKPGAVVMHPGPMNRGLEIDDPVADGTGEGGGPRSIILDQVSCGLPVRMAVIEQATGGPLGGEPSRAGHAPSEQSGSLVGSSVHPAGGEMRS
jgi:aspartate carbamoyltransferase catalytic subunit